MVLAAAQSPELQQFLIPVCSILLGWLLGMASPLILDTWRAKRRLKLIARGFQTDLAELQALLVVKAIAALYSSNTIERNDLLWGREALKKFDALAGGVRKHELIDELLAKSDTELATHLAERRERPVIAGRAEFQQFDAAELPYIEANLHSLPSFGEKIHGHLLTIRSLLSTLNQDIRRIESYQTSLLTTLASSAQGQLMMNIARKSQQIVERCRNLADRIGAVVPMLGA